MIALSAALVLSLAACGSQPKDMTDDSSDTEKIVTDAEPSTAEDSFSENVEIPNPFVDCDSLSEAVNIVGFDVVVPDSIDGYPEKYIRAIATDERKMAEVVYENDDENEIRIRKALGSEDISGDYNLYDQNNTVMVGELEVVMKGNGDTISLATWTNSDYTYSVYASAGISSEAISDLIAAIR